MLDHLGSSRLLLRDYLKLAFFANKGCRVSGPDPLPALSLLDITCAGFEVVNVAGHAIGNLYNAF